MSPDQPDVNWAAPGPSAVDFERTMRFWLERGVAGFRIVLAHGMVKPAALPDMDPRLGPHGGPTA